MMTKRLALILAAAALMPASALAQEPVTDPGGAATAESAPPPPALQALAESCAARKFETIVTIEGKPGGKKVKLCGREGQSDSDWVNTLKDAARKVEADPAMEQAVKDQITTALKAEIARIETPSGAVLANLPHDSVEPAERAPEYSTLPPLPRKPTVAAASRTDALEPPPAAAKRPKLTIKCSVPGESGGGSACLFFERETRLTIRADEDLEAGTSLRFLRKGDIRGEIALEPMRQGQILSAKLPTQVCSGVLSGKAVIAIVARGGNGAGQVVDRLGPFALRCRA